MASAKRRVKRSASSRQAIVSQYGDREWYDLPDWFQEWVAGAVGWTVLGLVIILLPAAALAVVIGAHSIPLEFIGIPPIGTGVGLAAVILLIEFILMVLAVRPLVQRRSLGWRYALGASIVHLVHSVILGHAISGVVLLVLTFYLYRQTRRFFA